VAQIDDRALLPGVTPSSAVPDGGIHLNVRPAAFGGQVAEATQQFGSTVLAAGQHWGQIAADDMSTQYETQVRKLLYGDPSKTVTKPDGTTGLDTGYFGLEGRLALDARKPTEDRMDQLIKETRGKLTSFDQQKAFDAVSRRYRNIMSTKVGEYADRQAKTYATGVNTATIKEQVEQIATNPNDDDMFMHHTANMVDAATKNAQLHGAQPGDAMWNSAQNAAKAAAVETRLRAIGADNPLRAKELAQTKYRADLGSHYDNVIDHLRARADQQEGREYADGRLSGSAPNENNIGNVRPRGSNTGFVQVKSFDEGVSLAVQNGRAYPGAFNGGKDMSLQQIGARWAPKGDGANDPNQWANNVAAGSGLPVDKPINLNDPETAAKFARGVHLAEWGSKKVRPLEDYKKAMVGSSPVNDGVSTATQAELLEGVEATNMSPEAKNAARARINHSYALRNATETKRKAEFKQRVDDGLAEAFHTGQPPPNPMTEGDFVKHLGPEDGAAKYADYQSNVQYGIDRKSLETMSDIEMQNFVSKEPQPGKPGYAHAMNRQAQLQKDATAIQKARREDPGGAVATNGAVQDALARYRKEDASSFQPVAAARLEAQRLLGIDPEYRSPITKAEALQLTTPLDHPIPGTEAEEEAQTASKFRQMFGDNAQQAFAYALRVRHTNDAVSQQTAAAFNKLSRGEPLTRADAAAFDSARADSAERAAIQGRGAPGSATGEFRPHRPGSAQDLIRPMSQNPDETGFEGSPSMTKPAPTSKAIVDLQKGILPPDKFDILFGTGLAKEILQKFPAAPGMP
jgi:hypothetical protein